MQGVKINFKTMFFGGFHNAKCVKKIISQMPVSEQVAQREITELNSQWFTESKLMNKGTLVQSNFRLNKEHNNAQIFEKTIYPARARDNSPRGTSVEYLSQYSDKGVLLATLRCDYKNGSYTTFIMDPVTRKPVSYDGIGAFNRATI